MGKKLTLEQNLCSARIFLNLFDLVLETKEEINEFDKLNILDKNNNQVGILYLFKNETIKIQSVTSLGTLDASYDLAEFLNFGNLECGDEWNHIIDFQVAGDLNFNGNMQISADSDIEECRVHAKIKYIDEDNNNVELKFMDDGYLFNYKAKKDNFTEELRIDPWSEFDSFMYHLIRNGKYDTTHGCFPSESLKFVWHNGSNDTNHLRTVVSIIENSKTKEFDSQLYESVGEKDSAKSTIQKGLLMQQIDVDFSKKIIELTSLFKKGNVSFFTNLIDVTFNKVTKEERNALFGTDLEKIRYYNGASNLSDAYFDTKESNPFLVEKSKNKILK